jgi:ankyrin repeat protein
MKLLNLLNLLQELRTKSRIIAVDIQERLSVTQKQQIHLRQENANILLQSTLADLKNQYGEIGALYFKQMLTFCGLSHLLKEAPQKNAEPYPEQSEYASYYSQDLYQTVLPLCKLIYLEECNGVPEQHAFHLSLIFNDLGTVLKYLAQFAKGNKSEMPLHDACLFDLPAPSSCNFMRWKQLANQKSSTKELMMLSPYFRDILPHASILERMEQAGKNRVLDKKAIDAKEQEVITVFKAFKTLLQTPREDDNAEQKEQRKTKLSELSKNLLALRLELTTLSQGTPLEEASIPMLQAFYAAYQEQAGHEYKILVQHGLSDQAKKLFETLTPANNDEYIPNVFIAGSELDYPGFYLKKLDVLHPKGAALAACLGKITNCCQYLGGAGEPCAIHGINSPLGGFYVLCRGDESNPDIEDPVIAQSWVWRSHEGMLCLDSIEAASTQKNMKLISDMYRYLGLKLCEQPHITQVNTGTESGVSAQVALAYPAPYLHPVDYTKYRDSHSQLLLAHKEMPYIFYGNITSVPLQSLINTRTESYFKAIFNEDGLLQVNPRLYQVIAFLIDSDQDDEQSPLFQLLTTHAGEQSAMLKRLIGVNRSYLQSLRDQFVDFDALQQGAYIQATICSGSALHIAVANDDMSACAQLLALKINLDLQKKNGNTALHQALYCLYTKKYKAADAIAKMLIDHNANLELGNEDENTPLIIAVANNDLDMVCYLVKHGALIDSRNSDMKTAIFLAAERRYESIFNYLLGRQADLTVLGSPNNENMLMAASKQEGGTIFNTLLARKEINIKHRNKQGTTALYYVMDQDPERVKNLMKQCPESKRLDMLKVAGNEGTLLHNTEARGHNFKIILELLPEEQQFALTHIRDTQGNTIFHSMVRFNQYFVDSLEVYPKQQRLELLLRTNSQKQTALHKAALFLVSLKMILALIPTEQLWDEIMRQDMDGNNLLHLAATANEPACLKKILEYLPPKQRLTALNKTNNKGHTVLYCALEQLASLEYLLELYSAEQQAVDAIQVIDTDSKNALALANNIQSRLCILNSYPEEQRLEAIKATSRFNSKGNNILHQAHNNSILLLGILKLIPENDKLSAVKTINKKGQTLLHLTQQTELFSAVLGLYPEDQRLDAVYVVDMDDQTPLTLALHDSTNLPALWTLIPEKQRLPTAKKKDKNGKTLLHLTYGNSDTMQVILKEYPKDERIDALIVADDYGETMLDTVVRSDTLFTLIPSAQRLKALRLLSEASQRLDFGSGIGLEQKIPILPLIPQEERLEALSLFHDGYGNQALHCVNYQRKQIYDILTLLTLPQRIAALQLINEKGESVLHKMVYSHEILSDILSLVSEDLEPLLFHTNAKGNTVFELIACRFKSLQAIMPFIPEDRLIDLFLQVNTEDETVLHTSARSEPDAFRLILSSIPEAQRLAWLTKPNKKRSSVLHDAAWEPESMRIAWELVPQNQKMDLFQLADKEGQTLLHLAVSHPKSLKVVLDFLPEDQRMIWVQRADKVHLLLVTASFNAQSIKIILELYSEAQRAEVLTALDTSGYLAIFYIALVPWSLKMALNLIPDDQRLPVIKAVDKHGNSALHGAACNFESLNTILNLYPEEQRLEAVKCVNIEGDTTLHHAARNLQCIQIILNLYPQNQRLDAVKLANKKGQTVLHRAVASVESLKELLSLYPENEQLAAIYSADEEGQTVLQLAVKHPESLAFLNDLISKAAEQKLGEIPSLRTGGNGISFFEQNIPIVDSGHKSDAPPRFKNAL